MVQFIFLGIVMRVVALLVEGGIAFFAGPVGERLRRSPQLHGWLARLAGCLLVAVGLRLMLMDRPQDVMTKPQIGKEKHKGPAW